MNSLSAEAAVGKTLDLGVQQSIDKFWSPIIDGIKELIPSNIISGLEMIFGQSPFAGFGSHLPKIIQTVLGVFSITIFIWAAGHILFLITTFLKECRNGCVAAAEITAPPMLVIEDLRISQLQQDSLNSKKEALIQTLSDGDAHNSIQEFLYKKLINAKMNDLEDQVCNSKSKLHLSK